MLGCWAAHSLQSRPRCPAESDDTNRSASVLLASSGARFAGSERISISARVSLSATTSSTRAVGDGEMMSLSLPWR